MPKINVYLPDDLADAVREAGLPVSAICQRALEQSVRRVATIREAVLTDLGDADPGARLASFTDRTAAVLRLAIGRAREAGAATVTTSDLLHGMLAEGGNLALKILTVMDVAPGSLTAPGTPERPATDGAGLRFSAAAAVALELAVGEAIGLGHNYVGCEHLLIGLAAEPDGAAGALLRERGADAKSTRAAVTAALAGYRHLRAAAPTPDQRSALRAALHTELAPLVARIERLESAREAH